MNIIWTKIREKDEESFKSLFFYFYPKLVPHAQKYLFDRDQSEDIVQEVFIDLWKKSHEIEIKTSINSYLYAMVRNRCINYLHSINITEGIEALDLLADSSQKFEINKNNKNKKYHKVMSIVDTFPDRMRKVFKLKYYDNHTYNEIATRMDISINTVKTQLRRARKRLDIQLNN